MALKIEELEKLALLDNLTQLANRHYIEFELEGRLAEMGRYGLSFGLLFMDIDHFKRFNDTYGHDVGDTVPEYGPVICCDLMEKTLFFGF